MKELLERVREREREREREKENSTVSSFVHRMSWSRSYAVRARNLQ
jgi:hypothetical protein